MMEVSRRELLVLLAATCILALVLLPGLLVRARAEEVAASPGPRAAPLSGGPGRDLLVRDPVYSLEGAEGDFWRRDAQEKLARDVRRKVVDGRARNIIFFLGDGMGVSTLTAARIHKGQKDPGLTGGEQDRLVFEEFPHLALVRTYCYDATVADSACSATSYLCGVKGNANTVGVTASVLEGDCAGQQVPSNRATSLLAWAQEAGKATGLVTTDSLTGASPSGAFAHSANRDWENDTVTPAECEDIASQLITGEVGRGMQVILGGGSSHLQGRQDGRDLVGEWRQGREGMEGSEGAATVVTSRQELAGVNSSLTSALLGVFAPAAMDYHLDREESSSQPTLAEMTGKALELLEGRQEGFVLFVEAALVDKAHHDNKARKSLDEVLELERAVDLALSRVDLEETLVIVTADHSHGFTLSGYPDRGTDIFGYDPLDPSYLSLMYATGPGHKAASWSPLGEQGLGEKDFTFPSTVYRSSAAHQGEEVPVYAVGPQAHRFQGLLQQHQLPHILAYAACLGQGLTLCNIEPENTHTLN